MTGMIAIAKIGATLARLFLRMPQSGLRHILVMSIAEDGQIRIYLLQDECRQCEAIDLDLGTLSTRSRVSFFMNKFRQLGFIDCNGSLEVHSSLLSVVLHDEARKKSVSARSRTST
jgi:hypothetical protein